MTALSPVTHHPSFTLKAAAKINWFLHVLYLRDDGFHEIRSLMQKITLYDVLTFSPSHTLTVVTKAHIPLEHNLVYKAATLLKNTYGIGEGARIRLEKNIPVGAGLGGGSSDAAATLTGLSRLWSLNIDREELAALAAKLGSDVPFFLYGPLAFAEGRGERLLPCKAEKSVNLLLVKPPIPVSTAWAYKEIRESRSTDQGPKQPSELTNKSSKSNNIELLNSSICKAGLKDIADSVSNDLESVVIRSFPVIEDIKRRLISKGATVALMSGSGSTVFGVFQSREEAEKVSKSFSDHWTAVVQTMSDGV